jgi:hypothetical protein
MVKLKCWGRGAGLIEAHKSDVDGIDKGFGRHYTIHFLR